MKNIKKIIIVNVISTIVLLIFAEILLGIIGRKQFHEEYPHNKILPVYRYKGPDLNLDHYKCNVKNNCMWQFREPVGLEYKTPPIVIFGCSFAHGHYLKKTQTFGYKLSKLTKRPVYNRALQGKGLAQMLRQTEDEHFYETVPEADTYIYIIISDTFRRMLTYKFNPAEPYFSYHYKYDKKHNDLVPDKYDNKFINLLKSTYLAGYFNAHMAKYILKNHKNDDYVANIAALHFIKAKENIEKHYNKKKEFIVIFYDHPWELPFAYYLCPKLIQNGFKIVKTNALTNEKITNDEKYYQDNHPTEESWDLLTPLIIEAGDIKVYK